MTPADKRMAELVERWLNSVDLHLQYVELDDESYSRVQAWPKHDRPTRWVLELARQKVLELKSQCESRVTMGDTKFAESLELMAFLANLIGAQHIQRFVPLANPQSQQAQRSEPSRSAAAPESSATVDLEATREMPQVRVASTQARVATRAVQDKPRPAKDEVRKPPQRALDKEPRAPLELANGATEDMPSKIVADAVRLLKWGRQWHELAELITRMADRPNATEVRRVLRAHKADIEAQAGA